MFDRRLPLLWFVRPNKAQITRTIYEAKIARWRPCWPKLEIVPWDAAPTG